MKVGSRWAKAALIGATSLSLVAAERCSFTTKEGKLLPFTDPDNKGGWTLNETFSDEFDGEKLDSNKWNNLHPYWEGRAPSMFEADNVSIKDGKLYIATKHETIPAMKGDYKDYTTGILFSRAKAFYGYYETKAKPANASISSAFWLQGDETEIDVFELVGNPQVKPEYATKIPINLHYFKDGDWANDMTFQSTYETGETLRDGFHIYGVDWGKEEIKFYYDGKLVNTQPNVYWHEPEYVIFDSETYYWHGFPSIESLPANFEVEYVRAWTRKDETK